MYGWFEPGESVNKYFNNTKEIDILLRSSTYSNNIVIGNGNGGNAAIYIQNNSIGIQKIPDLQYAIDVDLLCHFDSIHMNKMHFDSTTIKGDGNLYIDYQGTLRNKIIITDNIKTIVKTILGVKVINFDNAESIITFESQNDLSVIGVNTILNINDVLYRVTKCLNYFEFQISFFYNTPTNPEFTIGDTLDINVLDDFLRTDSGDEIIINFAIYSIEYVNSYSLKFSLNLMNIDQIDYLEQGRFFSLSSRHIIENVVILDYLKTNLDGSLQIILSTPDRSPFPVATFSFIMQLILLDVIIPKPTLENNVIGGIYNNGEPYLMIKNSNLINIVNIGIENGINTICNLNLNDYLSYDVEYIFSQNNLLLAKLSTLNTSYAFSILGTLSYQLIGYPIQITSITTIDIGFLYKFIDFEKLDLNKHLKKYINNLVYIAGNKYSYVCKIIDVKNNEFVLDRLITLVGSFLYIIPFKASRSTTISLAHCYIPESLSIGVKLPTEVLTVNGDIGTSSIVFRHPTSKRNFVQTYSSNILNMNDKITIETDNIILNSKTQINGKVISEGYLSFSDRKLKKNIKLSKLESDLKTIKNINVHNFLMKDSHSYQKGVIAQELEKVLPHIVKTNKVFLNSICKWGHFTKCGKIIFPGCTADKESIDDLKEGVLLKYMVNGKEYTNSILNVSVKKDSVILKLRLKKNAFSIGSKVYIYGPYSNCKTIDKDYLFMTLLNAVKCLAKNLGM